MFAAVLSRKLLMNLRPFVTLALAASLVAPAAPAGYIGHPGVLHTVVGSQVLDLSGEPTNYFAVRSPLTTIGSTDKQAASITDRPITPSDMAATLLHALGIDPGITLHTPLGRPIQLAGGGRPVHELFL